MKIFVTGGCGFIGTNFILDQMKSTQNQILNFDKLTYAGNKDNLSSINSNNYNFVKGNICDSEKLLSTLKIFKPNAIINFAAETHVDRSIENPIDFVKTNVLGTASLLQATFEFLNHSKENENNFKFIHVSTDEVYGSLGTTGLFTESTPYNPSSPYSASKASSDHLVRAWHKTFKFPSIITNCSNNYGPFQFPEKLIPLIIANCVDQKSLPVYGDGMNIRDWLFVEDHCKALNKVLTSGKPGHTYNIGGNNEITNIDIVKSICNIFDILRPLDNSKKYTDLIKFVDDRPGHDFRYAIDSSKISREINWIAKETFKTGIKKTIEWYLDNENWWRAIQKKTYAQERIGILSV